MNITDRIEFDIADLKAYFAIVSNAVKEKPEWSYFHSNSKFNMVIEIYGCLDYWLKTICDYRKNRDALNLAHSDIRGNNDLAAYNKYLEKIASVNMSLVKKEYDHLHSLRKVRNCIVHSGAHSEDVNLNKIVGISFSSYTLLSVSEEFLENSLVNAKAYLLHAANA